MPFKDAEERRAYQREYMRGWYQRNKARHISYVRKRELGIQLWFKEYKTSLSCERCGESHPACLDFHHVDPGEKKFSVSNHHERPSLEALKAEIAKCCVLCSNCHRKEHWEDRARQREAKEARK